ncbi:ethanolamine ammonia-lyase subunit EutC [Nocardioides sp. GY 10113]|uniref:ethanolamine ammonia-lyase subunit EutC n=1 Tax=Nocardioides sp. GY 10113 TaxID=2569761 RepID=UPI0010A77CF0|nr:ethanolamine ammonia-lyase subunit EutC [Nocardioides sp. GY 10113]TIC87777.1 ethanolamine ammonia-lyase subunit EutC [Nocardioides sp. GY 10113]
MSGGGAGGDDFWAHLRGATPARIGLGRAGNALTTAAVLEAGAAHALARDAVHRPVDVGALAVDLSALGLGEVRTVASAAPDRATYLTRPDLGRVPAPGRAGLAALADLAPAPDADPGLAVVVADGLSSAAVEAHAAPLLAALLPLLDAATRVAPPVIATQARVALGDHVGQALGARLLLVLIGERPGLSASDSLGAYLTWQPRPGVQDSARNCVSNIRPPHGLDYDTAARTIASLVAGARTLGATGVRLKAGVHELG